MTFVRLPLFKETLTRANAGQLIAIIADACRQPTPELIRNATWPDCDAVQSELLLRQLGEHADHGMVKVITHEMYRQAMSVATDIRSGSFRLPLGR
jgi:hypothetical protein